MPYQNLQYCEVLHPVLLKVLRHADEHLFDVFGMFQYRSNHQFTDLSMVLILLCIVDGIARNIYPTQEVDKQEKRFKRLLREKLPWSTPSRGWIDRGEAAKYLYLEFRNPLVHELGQDKVTPTRQRSGLLEPKIGTWGEIDAEFQDIERIEALCEWNDQWPVLYKQKEEQGSRIKLCSAALYWAVKYMIKDLVHDGPVMANAARAARSGLRSKF